jgi:hypothetical protein
LDNFTTFVSDNDATLTGKVLTTATDKANLTTINGPHRKKKARDNQRTLATTAQQAFPASAAANYTAFSDPIDTVAGALAKKTPAGKQVGATANMCSAANTRPRPHRRRQPFRQNSLLYLTH